MNRQPRLCPHGHHPFVPNQFNHHHQRYCSQPQCRQASAREKRRRWREKKKFDLDFRAQEVRRVQEWRRRHPDDARRSRADGHDPPAPATPPPVPLDHLVPSSPPTITRDDLATLQDRVQRHADILAGLAWQTVGAHPDQVATFISRGGEQGRQFREMAAG